MRYLRSCRLTAPVFGLLFILVAGCAGSTPSRFYSLDGLKTEGVKSDDASREGSVIVSVGPVRMPDYLDRPQIVTRSGRNEIILAEFDRWAGPLESDMVRVLVENISAILPAERFFVMRWAPTSSYQMPPAYKVHLLLYRFDGPLGGPVLLRAQWAVFAKDRDLLVKRDSSIVEQVQGNDYKALVEAMSRALEQLSKEIADAIMSLPVPAVPKGKG